LKLKARDVDRALSRPDPDIQAFVIFGPDSGLVRERANTLAGALVEDPDDPFTVTRLTEDDIKSDPAALSDAMAAMSLLGTAPLVRVRLSGDLTAVGTYLTDLDKGQTAAEARLIVEAGDLKKSSKLRKAAEDGARFIAAPCYADDARDLIKLADEMLAAEGLSLAPDARAMLAPYLEGDRALARGEIDKLILYKGLARQRPEGEATIERADIAAISAAGAEAALDQIIDPAFSGDPVSADRAYARALSSGISPSRCCACFNGASISSKPFMPAEATPVLWPAQALHVSVRRLKRSNGALAPGAAGALTRRDAWRLTLSVPSNGRVRRLKRSWGLWCCVSRAQPPERASQNFVLFNKKRRARVTELRAYIGTGIQISRRLSATPYEISMHQTARPG
jgi:DNA polymerase-3 subunit delta